MSLAGKVCVVTGATRGIGKGIALQLGENGAKVYITGRTLTSKEKLGSLTTTADEIASRGGSCVPIECDHSKDAEVDSLFARVAQENEGQLDILVNNAYSAGRSLLTTSAKKFYELPYSAWDEVNNVGVRNHYVCAWHAARLMQPHKRGIIVNISSMGGLQYFLSVPYGVGKAACDRMAADCAVELRPHNVAFVSLWPGPVRTEAVGDLLRGKEAHLIDKMIHDSYELGESIEFAGKCVVALCREDDIMKRSGKILLTSDIAAKHNLIVGFGRISMEKGLHMCEALTIYSQRLGGGRSRNCFPHLSDYPNLFLRSLVTDSDLYFSTKYDVI